jgi:hypothetical protein
MSKPHSTCNAKRLVEHVSKAKNQEAVENAITANQTVTKSASKLNQRLAEPTSKTNNKSLNLQVNQTKGSLAEPGSKTKSEILELQVNKIKKLAESATKPKYQLSNLIWLWCLFYYSEHLFDFYSIYTLFITDMGDQFRSRSARTSVLSDLDLQC